MPRRPVDAITLDEAGLILGCSRTGGMRGYVARGQLTKPGRYLHRQYSRAEVEALACQVYRWRQHLDDPEPYWVTGRRAADILGVGPTRLRQLAAEDRVPFVRHMSGAMLYRRLQLEVIAKAASAALGRIDALDSSACNDSRLRPSDTVLRKSHLCAGISRAVDGWWMPPNGPPSQRLARFDRRLERRSRP